MTPFHNDQNYYKKMLELQERLRKSEEERIRLEERFNLLTQESRSRHEACINRLRLRYIEFLEEQRSRDERNHKLLGSLDKIDSSLALMTAKTDRLSVLRKQYEAYLLRVYANRCPDSGTADSGIASQNDERSLRNDGVRANPSLPTLKQRVVDVASHGPRRNFPQGHVMSYSASHDRSNVPTYMPTYVEPLNVPRIQVSQPDSQPGVVYEQGDFPQRQQMSYVYGSPVVHAQSDRDLQQSVQVVVPSFMQREISKMQTIGENISTFSSHNNSNDRLGQSLVSQNGIFAQDDVPRFDQPRVPQTELARNVAQSAPSSVTQVLFDPNVSRFAVPEFSQNCESGFINAVKFIPTTYGLQDPKQPIPQISQSQFSPVTVTQFPRQSQPGPFKENDVTIESGSIGTMESDLRGTLMGNKNFDSYAESTPLPGYLNYSVRYSKNLPRTGKEYLSPRSMTKTDLENLIKRNECILPKDYLTSIRSPQSSKLTAILNKSSVVLDEDKSTKVLENELDRYISNIKNLHRDLDFQSLEEVDHEQNTSGDLLNVTLSEDGPELSVEEKTKEKQIPEEIEEVLALADDLVSRTVNVDNPFVRYDDDLSERQVVGDDPKKMSVTAVENLDKLNIQVTSANVPAFETRSDVLSIQDDASTLFVANDGINANIAPLSVEITQLHQNIKGIAKSVQNSVVDSSISMPNKQHEKDQQKATSLGENDRKLIIPAINDADKEIVEEGKEEVNDGKVEEADELKDMERVDVKLIEGQQEIEERVLNDTTEVEPSNQLQLPMTVQGIYLNGENKGLPTEMESIDSVGQSNLTEPKFQAEDIVEEQYIAEEIVEKGSFEKRKMEKEYLLRDREKNLDLENSQKETNVETLPVSHEYSHQKYELSQEVDTSPSYEPDRDQEHLNLDRNREHSDLQTIEQNYKSDLAQQLRDVEHSQQEFENKPNITYEPENNQQYEFVAGQEYEQRPPIKEYDPVSSVYESDRLHDDPDRNYELDTRHQEYEEHGNQQYEHDVNEQHADQQYNTRNTYKHDPNEQYEHYTNQEYELDQKAEYERYSSEQYKQYEQDPNQQYEHDPNQQYEYDPNQQYKHDPNQQYEHNPNQEYEHEYDPNQQYEHDPNQQYEYDSSQPYGYSAESYELQEKYDHAEGNPEEFDQSKLYNPDQQYFPEANVQGYSVEQNYEDSQNQDYSRNPDGQDYNIDPHQSFDQTHATDNEIAEHLMGQEIEQVTPEIVAKNLQSEDVTRVDRYQKEVVEQNEEKNKMKDVIRSLLDSDTESTIERNVSNNTESDFDFN